LKNPTAEERAYSKLLAYAAIQFPAYEVTAFNALMAKELEKAERGEVKRLMIFMPPRHGKTKMVSMYFPAWYLGRNPSHEVIFTSYNFERAKDVGRDIRNQLDDPTHRRVFPDCEISADSKGVTSLATDQGGHCFSVGIGGGVTGRGAHLFIVDDPLKGRKEAESAAHRKTIQDWFLSVAYTRLAPNGIIILVTTRWHFDDLAGYLREEKKHENWTIIEFPAVAVKDDILGRKPGDALWPTRYPIQVLDVIKETIGTREWNALYQQNPLPGEGGTFQLEWFRRYRVSDHPWRREVPMLAVEDIKQVVCSWDTAFKAKELNDPSACTVWAITDAGYYLLYVVNRKLEYPDLKRFVIKTWKDNSEKYREKGVVPVLIEDKASGQSLIQDLRRNEKKMDIIAIKTKGDKEVRAAEISAIVEAGKVHIPVLIPWLVDFETQIAQFPYSKYDDIVDSMSQFLQWAKRPKYRRSKKPLFWK